jgi:hypothetical protein
MALVSSARLPAAHAGDGAAAETMSLADLTVTSLCAEGSGWSDRAVGQLAWDEGGFTVALEGPDTPERLFRSGPEASRRAAMFQTFLSALETGRAVRVVATDSADGGPPMVLQVVLPVQ